MCKSLLRVVSIVTMSVSRTVFLKLAYGLLFVFHCNYGLSRIVFEITQGIDRKSHLHLTPPLVVPITFGMEKLVWLHTQLYSPFEKAAQLYAKNESENLTN